MRMDRPIGIYLLLWPTLWALWFAGSGKPSIGTTIIFLLGGTCVSMRVKIDGLWAKDALKTIENGDWDQRFV